MTWTLLAAAVAIGVLLAGAWWLGSRPEREDDPAADSPPTGGPLPDGLPMAVRGYRMDQVDDVVARLEARVEEHDREIAALRGEPPPIPAADPPPGPATGPLALLAQPTAAARPDEVGRADAAPPRRRRNPLPGEPAPLTRLDLVFPVLALLGAAYLLQHLLAAPGAGYLSQGVQDQQAFEWYFGATAHNLATFSNPLWTDLQNYPAGVNLMANAAVLGLGVPLAPLTLLTAPQVTFVLVELLGLAATATAWYWLFRRWLPVHPVAAALGAALAGFGPGMVSHANGHPNFVVQALIPLVLDRLLRLASGSPRPRRDGVVLGLLVAWQILIGEEVLLLAAVGIAIFGAVLLAHGRRPARSALPGLATGVGIAVALTALPLWWQFFGPQSYHSIWHPPAGNDLAQLWGRATRSIGADPWASAAVSMNRTEENAFFGIPLWFAAAAVLVAAWRSVLVRALAVVVLVSCWVSLGEEVTLHGSPLGIPGPWALLEHVPVVENVLPTRFALVALPAFAALLAVGVELVRSSVARHLDSPGPGLALGAVTALVVLLPVLPTPLVVDPRPGVPAFFADGQWRQYVDDGGSVLAVPPPNVADARAVTWQAEARWGFPLVAGYFVGPGPDGVGQYGASPTGLSNWLWTVDRDGQVVTPSAQERAGFTADLRAAHVDALVLPVGRPNERVLLASVTEVFGAPTEVGSVYVWDVRGVTDGQG